MRKYKPDAAKHWQLSSELKASYLLRNYTEVIIKYWNNETYRLQAHRWSSVVYNTLTLSLFATCIHSKCVRCWVMLWRVIVCRFAWAPLQKTNNDLADFSTMSLFTRVSVRLVKNLLPLLLTRFIATILFLHTCSTCPASRGCCCSLPSHWAGGPGSSPPTTRTCLLPRLSSAIHELRSLLPQVNNGIYRWRDLLNQRLNGSACENIFKNV